MRKHWLLIGLAVSIVTLVLLVGLLIRVQLRREQRRIRLKDFEKTHVGIEVPPRNYSAWYSEYGDGEPDGNTAEGRKYLQEEKIRLPSALVDFQCLLESLPEVYVSTNDNAVESFLHRVDELLGRFSRAGRADILRKVYWGCSVSGVDLESILSESSCMRIAERYCMIFSQFADWIWLKVGDSFEAAEVDNGIIHALYNLERFCKKKGWNEARSSIDARLTSFLRDRCESEQSNFCRAHRECEQWFHLYYEAAVRKDPELLKVTGRWYRWHLNWAREFLGHDPRWSTDGAGDVKPNRR